VHASEFLDRRNVLSCAAPGATVLLNTAVPTDRVWDSLPREAQQQLIDRRCKLFVIDGYAQSERAGLGRRINTVMQLCFFALSKVLPMDQAMQYLQRSLEETWGRRGPEVVRRNLAAFEGTLAAMVEVPVPVAVTATRVRPPAVPANAPNFAQRVTRQRSGKTGHRAEHPHLANRPMCSVQPLRHDLPARGYSNQGLRNVRAR
jgi:pyruvate-ferredoxin/flavodoxin oxidoreductase